MWHQNGPAHVPAEPNVISWWLQCVSYHDGSCKRSYCVPFLTLISNFDCAPAPPHSNAPVFATVIGLLFYCVLSARLFDHAFSSSLLPINTWSVYSVYRLPVSPLEAEHIVMGRGQPFLYKEFVPSPYTNSCSLVFSRFPVSLYS